jgi:hypothetical protein
MEHVSACLSKVMVMEWDGGTQASLVAEVQAAAAFTLSPLSSAEASALEAGRWSFGR